MWHVTWLTKHVTVVNIYIYYFLTFYRIPRFSAYITTEKNSGYLGISGHVGDLRTKARQGMAFHWQTEVSPASCVHNCIETIRMKKTIGDANTAHMAVVTRSQKFLPRRRPLPGGAGPPKFNQLEMVAMHLQTQFGEDRCTQYRVLVVTDTARPPVTHPDRTDYNTLRRS